jgi:hypothetical protein
MVVTNCPFQRLLQPCGGAMSQNGCGPAGPGRPAVDPFADWESMFESGELDASLRHLDLSKPPPGLAAGGGPARPAVILQEQEDGRTEYRPPEPKMTIMKRPDAKERAEGGGEGGRPRAQQKSLKQREQEYAEARQRILGSLGGPAEEPAARAPGPPQVKVRVKGGPPRMEVIGPPPPAVSTAPRLPYSAQRQFRLPPPCLAASGPPPPLAVARHPRGPPTDGSRGFPGPRR